MLILSSDKSDNDSFFLKLLAKNLRLEEFKDLQILTVNSAMQATLRLESVPIFIDTCGRPLLSLQGISRKLTDMVKMTPLLVGCDENEASCVLKWFEMEFDFG